MYFFFKYVCVKYTYQSIMQFYRSHNGYVSHFGPRAQTKLIDICHRSHEENEQFPWDGSPMAKKAKCLLFVVVVAYFYEMEPPFHLIVWQSQYSILLFVTLIEFCCFRSENVEKSWTFRLKTYNLFMLCSTESELQFPVQNQFFIFYFFFTENNYSWMSL